MIINKYCEKSDLSYLKNKYSKYIQYFITSSDDCLFKNLSIIDFAINNNGPKDKFIDCGSGPSPLAWILCDYFTDGYMIDISVSNQFAKDNLHHNIGDFFSYIQSHEDSSIDYAFDGCSITHFEHDSYNNIGFNRSAELLSKKIKDGGYVVMSTDVIDHLVNNRVQMEYLKVSDIIEIFNSNGFKLISNFDYDSLNDDCSINLNYYGRSMIKLVYCNLTFQKISSI